MLKRCSWMLMGLICLVSVIIPSAAAASSFSLEAKYWRPSVNESVNLIGLNYPVPSQSTAQSEPGAWITLEPVLSGHSNYIITADLTLHKRLGFSANYWRLSAADSLGSWDEPFDFSPYAPQGGFGNPSSMYVWNTTIPVTSIAGVNYKVMAAKAVEASALDGMITYALPPWGRLDTKLGLGARKASLDRTEELAVGAYLPMIVFGKNLGTLGTESQCDTSQSFSLIGPSVGLWSSYRLSDRFSVSARAVGSYLRTSLNEVGTFDTALTFVKKNGQVVNILTPPTAENELDEKFWIPTVDFELGLAFRLMKNVALKAGYYRSMWFSVPNPYVFNTGDEGAQCSAGWEEGGVKNLHYGGFNVGVQIRF